MKIKIGDIPAIIFVSFIAICILIAFCNSLYNLFIADICNSQEVFNGLFIPCTILIIYIIYLCDEYSDKEIDFSKIINYFKNLKL